MLRLVFKVKGIQDTETICVFRTNVVLVFVKTADIREKVFVLLGDTTNRVKTV